MIAMPSCHRLALAAWSGTLLLAAACGTSAAPASTDFIDNTPAEDASPVDDAAVAAEVAEDGAARAPSTPARPVVFHLSPSDAALELTDEPFPTLRFSLQADDEAVAQARYLLDREDLGSIDAISGLFTPSGAAGVVNVSASGQGGVAAQALKISVNRSQEGDPGRDALPAGAGGVGGVGGEGGGTPVADAEVRKALDAAPVTDPGLTWLYPYDRTVFPRGLPAPLLMWRSTRIAPLAVRIHVEVDDAFRYDGYFGPPSQAVANRPLTHLPLPQEVWRSALQSGATMRVSLVVVGRDDRGALVTRTPSENLTWTIASGSLKGTVYYNSYGTKLAENYAGAVGGNGRFGGATLAVRGDSFDPMLVAGATTRDASGCRVCHTVSGDGSLLMAQQADNMATSTYDLRNGNVQTLRPERDRGKFGWAALSPDGKVALGNAGPPGENAENIASLATSALYDVTSGDALATTGLTSFVSKAATPVFSPDGSMVAFNLWAGPGTPTIQANGKSLVIMDIAQRADGGYDFTNPRSVYDAEGDAAPAWPSFLPGGAGVVFERELARGPDGERFMTRGGARGELWWSDLDGHAAPLTQANGAAGLPSSAAHPDDKGLQFEPAVGPIVAGGYAWVVFTSRRLYGDVATRPPYESDPRAQDLTAGASAGPTTKKLWVFAIDMPPKPGTDPSHPAFYLPAQELFAGNSRGFWVPDACKSIGVGCESGDECCGGFCRSVTELGDKVCSDSLPPASCAMEYEACATDANCCDGGNTLFCIGERCAQQGLR
jgi:hypothetical protein